MHMRNRKFSGLSKDIVDRLKKFGAQRSSDYYRLSYNDQRSLIPEISLGGLALDAGDPNYRCTELELPANPEPGIVTPVVEWTWRGAGGTTEHIIDSRPWWGVPNQEVDETSSKFEEQKYWYPDPALGWKVFGYQFGGTGGQLGYLLVYNNYTGIMRLFVYLPGVEQRNFNQLLCRISITDPSYVESPLWSFPLQDQPPTIRNFEKSAPGSGGPENNFEDIPYSLTTTWPGKDVPYHRLTAAVSGTNGIWLRTEISTLFDPRLYPSTQPLRPLGGCLSIFFPGGASGTEIRQDDRRMLRIRFYTVLEGETDLEANLNMDLSGKAIPSAGIQDVLGVVKGVVLTSISAASGVSGALTFLGATAGSGGAAAAVAAAALVGGFFGLIADNAPPEYKVMTLGTASGTITGKTVFVTEATMFDLNLSDTFIPQIDSDGQYMPTGFPQNYQRCELVRFGLYGFRPHGTDNAYLNLDPRPEYIFQDWYPDQSLEFNIPYVVVGPLGYFQSAPWAEIDIVSQNVQLEVVDFSGTIPYDRVVIMQLFISDAPTGDIISREAVGKLRAVVRNLNLTIPVYTLKLLIRWLAVIQPRNPVVSSYTVQYALDVSGLLELLPEPGTGTDEWP